MNRAVIHQMMLKFLMYQRLSLILLRSIFILTRHWRRVVKIVQRRRAQMKRFLMSEYLRLFPLLNLLLLIHLKFLRILPLLNLPHLFPLMRFLHLHLLLNIQLLFHQIKFLQILLLVYLHRTFLHPINLIPFQSHLSFCLNHHLTFFTHRKSLVKDSLNLKYYHFFVTNRITSSFYMLSFNFSLLASL